MPMADHLVELKNSGTRIELCAIENYAVDAQVDVCSGPSAEVLWWLLSAALDYEKTYLTRINNVAV